MKNNKMFVIGILGLLLCSSFIYFNNEKEVSVLEYKEPNYEALLELGLIPSAELRYATEDDIYTGLSSKYEGYNFGIFESRNWETGDYGKTFISPINN